MKVTVGDVVNNKVDVRDYLNYDEETDRIYVDGLKLDTVLIDKSKEWESLVERNKRLREVIESMKSEIIYALNSSKSDDIKRFYLENAIRFADRALESESE